MSERNADESDASLQVAQVRLIQVTGEGMLTISAMPPIHHRDPGVIGLLGDPARSPYYGIIVDGLHSHPNTVRIAYGAKKDGCILVTDGKLHPVMRQCG
jgi:N-acetylglucosamine-6-phosphate deacetylase